MYTAKMIYKEYLKNDIYIPFFQCKTSGFGAVKGEFNTIYLYYNVCVVYLHNILVVCN
jgi:hypothetical protein